MLLASVALVAHLLAWTGDPRQTPPGPMGVASERRMYAVKSDQAWQRVQDQLRTLGFSFDKVDRTNHVVLTKWRAPKAEGLEWLPTARLPEEYVPERVRFLVFVSPFAEPARVYVGSMLEARKLGLTRASATVYNLRNLNDALMSEMSKALGEEGVPIPPDHAARRGLALSLLRDSADDCSKRESAPPGAKITPPQKIPISEFEVLYPPAAIKERAEGQVKVEFTVLEDGGVIDARLLDPPLGRQLGASALGAASLLLYRPTSLGECSVPTVMTYTVNYRLR